MDNEAIEDVTELSDKQLTTGLMLTKQHISAIERMINEWEQLDKNEDHDFTLLSETLDVDEMKDKKDWLETVAEELRTEIKNRGSKNDNV